MLFVVHFKPEKINSAGPAGSVQHIDMISWIQMSVNQGDS
jgi:hypothetical protein